METGVPGVLCPVAVFPVEGELNLALEFAIILHLLMVDLFVLDKAQKLLPAMNSIVLLVKQFKTNTHFIYLLTSN